MRVLIVGDVVGRPGREAVLRLLPALRQSERADFVIANAENAAAGIGITREIALALLEEAGVDVITLGNHAWAKREVYGFLNEETRILRPSNYPSGVPGRGYAIYNTPLGPVAVVVLQGRVFMDPVGDPFEHADRILAELRQITPIVFIDFHGEATSEKQAFGWHVAGRATAVLGTHTHVQTADERILTGGTAYLTDLGMTGPLDSVIGMKKEIVLPRFTTMLPVRFEVADGPGTLCGAVVELDPADGTARSIRRLQVPTAANIHG